MTAQVAVINRYGVALASDSMLSLSTRFDRAYTGFDKVFAVGRTIGLMIYGNADFMGDPMSTVAAEFARRHEEHATLEACAEAFNRFLSDYPFDEEYRLVNATTVVSSVLEAFVARMGDADATTTAREVDAAIAHHEARTHLDHPFGASFGRSHADMIDRCIERSGIDGRVARNRSRELVLASLASRDASPAAGGYVLTGFGETEMRPSLVSFETDGWLGSTLKIVRQEEDVVVEVGDGGAIAPFAQTGMIRRFIVGIDPELYASMLEGAGLAVHAALEAAYRHFADTTRQRRRRKADAEFLEATLRNVCGRYENGILERRHRRFVKPMTDMVAHLPPSAMAAYAAQLVATAAMDQRFGDRHQSIGGEVRVALITRGRGFEWRDSAGGVTVLPTESRRAAAG